MTQWTTRSFSPINPQEEACTAVCLADMAEQMSRHHLKLNLDKSVLPRGRVSSQRLSPWRGGAITDSDEPGTLLFGHAALVLIYILTSSTLTTLPTASLECLQPVWYSTSSNFPTPFLFPPSGLDRWHAHHELGSVSRFLPCGKNC